MRTHTVWLRLVVVSALRALYRPGGLRTLFLIDEMPALGHLGPLEDAFGLVRGYKVQIAGICQDLAQLKALYNERWESFLANAGVVQGFAPNDLTTADWMSRRAGQTTLVAPSSSESLSAATGATERRHELEPDQPRALSAARTDGLRRRHGPFLARGHGERCPLLCPALLENRAMRQARGAQSVLRGLRRAGPKRVRLRTQSKRPAMEIQVSKW